MSATTIKTPSGLFIGRACRIRVGEQAYDAEIVALAEDTIGLSATDYIGLEEGDGVELELPDHSGTAYYHTRVVVPPSQAGDGIILQRCEAAAYMKHRRTWRVPVDFRLQISPASGIPNRDGRMQNLSSEGALVSAGPGFLVGDDCRITVTFTGQATCVLHARVIHVSDGPEENGRYEYGVRFTEMPSKSRYALTWFLYDQIRKRYGNELRALYPRRKTVRPGKAPRQSAS